MNSQSLPMQQEQAILRLHLKYLRLQHLQHQHENHNGIFRIEHQVKYRTKYGYSISFEWNRLTSSWGAHPPLLFIKDSPLLFLLGPDLKSLTTCFDSCTPSLDAYAPVWVFPYILLALLDFILFFDSLSEVYSWPTTLLQLRFFYSLF